MKFRWENRYFHIGLTAFLVIAASMLFYYGIFHMDTLIGGIRTFLSIMAPIVYGLAIAYVLNPVVNFLESYVTLPILARRNVNLEKRGKKIVRWACVLISLILLLFFIYALIMMILPQLIRSVMSIIYAFPTYVEVVENWLNSIVEKGWDMDMEMIDMINQYSSEAQDYLTNNILPQMQAVLKNISDGVFDVLNVLKNFLIGAIVSVYVLADKEIFIARSKMIVYALFSHSTANNIIHSMRFTHQTFGGFINGKILDSAIIGVLCYVGVTILDMPYTILISVIIGVTNVIPFFGPYVGAVPCTLLILLVNPVQGVYFALFILVLQQFDGNILGPKILGDSTGLSSFMVIVAIMIGGGLFGVVGMIVGVPLCAVIYAAAWNLIGHFLRDKQMPDDTSDYLNIDCIDEESGMIVPLQEKKKTRTSREHPAPDSLFMKVWRTAQNVLTDIWKFLCKYGKIVSAKAVQYGKIFWENLKKTGIFLGKNLKKAGIFLGRNLKKAGKYLRKKAVEFRGIFQKKSDK